MKCACITLLISLIAAALVVADDQDGVHTDNHHKNGNAALEYWQAIEILIARHPDDPNYPEYYLRILDEGHKAPLDDRALASIRRSGVALYWLHRGSRVTGRGHGAHQGGDRSPH